MGLKGFESFISCTVHFDIKKYLSWDFVVGGCECNVICSDLFTFFLFCGNFMFFNYFDGFYCFGWGWGVSS